MNENYIKLIVNLGGSKYGTNIRANYVVGDTNSIRNCITNFGNKTKELKELLGFNIEEQGTIGYSIKFYRGDNTVIDEIDINSNEEILIEKLIHYFLYI